jgi:Kef-type K+ transport system membrane component KefB
VSETADTLPALDLLIGAVIIVAIVLKTGFERAGVPALVGFIALGLLLRVTDDHWGLISDQGQVVFEFLGSIGVITLLFQVGLESDFRGLVGKLPRASPIWIANVALSGLLAYWLTHELFGVALIPSLFVAAALTATSVAVSVEVWHEAHALHSPNGELLLDVAELDDITAVAFMAFIFAILPALQTGNESSLAGTLAEAAVIFVVKAVAFGAFCLIFARYAERPIVKFIKAARAPGPILLVAGTGILIAGVAGLLGFSLAIGALFAGLVFSRDPDVVHMDTLFEPIHGFFMPFFFIGIGLSMDPQSLLSATALGGGLLVAAILGKLVGAGGPAVFTTGWSGAIVIGISMVPRAEIALVIAWEGLKLGDWAMPPEVYSAVVVVAAVTCALVPIAVRQLLRRWPQ